MPILQRIKPIRIRSAPKKSITLSDPGMRYPLFINSIDQPIPSAGRKDIVITVAKEDHALVRAILRTAKNRSIVWHSSKKVLSENVLGIIDEIDVWNGIVAD